MTRRHAGFTLVEMLVVMSLLAVIMVATVSSLRTMAQTEARVDDRLQRVDQMRVVNSFIRKTLGRVDATKVAVPNLPGEQAVLFVADASSISWVGIMPARHGAGGRFFFRLAAETAGAEKALVLRYAPWAPQAAQPQFPDWSASESQVLVKNLESFAVEAQGLPAELQATLPDWPRGWQSGWSVKTAVPQQIRLSLQDQKSQWPPLVVAVLPTLQSRVSSGGFTTGGSAR